MPSPQPLTLLFLFLALALGACGRGGGGVAVGEEGTLLAGREAASAVEERAVRLEGRTLVLDGFAGEVRVTADPSLEEARLRFERVARGATGGSAERRLADVTLREAGDGDLYQFVWRSPREAGMRVDVEARVPPGTALTVRLGAGSFEARGLAGALDAELGNGDLRAYGLASPSVRLATGAGAVEAQAARIAPGTRWRVSSGAGTLTLGLPPDASADVDVETTAGRVRAEGLRFTSPRLTGGPSDARYRARLGAGGAQIEGQTGAGDVVLRAAGATIP